MTIKEVLVCDNCGEEIKANKNHYNIHQVRKQNQIVFKSKRFTDAAGSGDNNYITLDLCESCCRRGIKALEKIAEKE